MAMAGLDPSLGAAANYRAFAEEAHDRSPQYEQLALDVAADAAALSFIESLPGPKQQPNLVFSAARFLLGRAPEFDDFTSLIARRDADLRRVVEHRRTQTNEVGRCATLLPYLAALPPPLALIEVGASAGLTLLPDRYGYDYGSRRIPPGWDGAPTLRCEPRGDGRLPEALPEVTWRMGLDLHPLDVMSDDDVHWLRCLIWPGQDEREERLAQAVAVARSDPPPVYRGDLLTDLPGLASMAPADATLVVYHSAVLAYLPAAERARFAQLVRSTGAAWLSNEAAAVLPWVAVPRHEGQPFALVRDERFAAFTDPHGAWIEWPDSLADGRGTDGSDMRRRRG